MFCPVDGKACPDDLCHNGGCIQTENHEPMMAVCDECGAIVPEDEISDVVVNLCGQCAGDEHVPMDDEDW